MQLFNDMEITETLGSQGKCVAFNVFEKATSVKTPCKGS